MEEMKEQKEKKEKKEKKKKSLATKIIIGILLAVIIFILVSMGPFLLFWGMVFWEMLFVHPDKPEIERAEIPFVLEYEYKGEKRVIEDAMIYEYAGDSFALDGGTTRDWNYHMRDNEDYGFYYIDPEMNPNFYIHIDMNAEYYMGAPDCTYEPEEPSIHYWDETGAQYWEYEEIEELDIKILSWSDPQPIENTFK